MGKKYRSLRRPRTTQERRANAALEVRDYFRPRRGWKRLVNAYDDIPIHWRQHDCWKDLRKTQYKAV